MMAENVTPPPLFTGHVKNEPADPRNPEDDWFIYQSDRGPLGIYLRVWRTPSGEIDPWLNIDWDEWHTDKPEELDELIEQSTNLTRWLTEARALVNRLRTGQKQ